MKINISFTTNKLRALSAEGIQNHSSAVVNLVVFILGVINDKFDKWKKTEYNKEI